MSGIILTFGTAEGDGVCSVFSGHEPRDEPWDEPWDEPTNEPTDEPTDEPQHEPCNEHERGYDEPALPAAGHTLLPAVQHVQRQHVSFTTPLLTDGVFGTSVQTRQL